MSSDHNNNPYEQDNFVRQLARLDSCPSMNHTDLSLNSDRQMQTQLHLQFVVYPNNIVPIFSDDQQRSYIDPYLKLNSIVYVHTEHDNHRQDNYQQKLSNCILDDKFFV